MAARLYWRLDTSANNGNTFLALAEVEMRATAGGADECSGGTPSAVSEYNASFVAANAVDNSNTTSWTPLSPSDSGWWQYEFASAVDIVEYTIRGHNASSTRSPKDWALQSSADGSTWTTVDTRANETGWGLSELRTYSVSPSSSAARPRVFVCT